MLNSTAQHTLARYLLHQDAVMTANRLLLSEFHFRHIRFATRVALSLLTLSYFWWTLKQKGTPLWQLGLAPVLAMGYLGLHGYLHYQQPRFAHWCVPALDIAILSLVLWLDPTTPPPTLALLFTLLFNWQTNKTPNIAISLLLLALLIAVPLHLLNASPQATTSALFALLFLLTTFLSFGVLMKQQALIRKRQAKRQWQDPETGLITHQTLILTADWLLPLHNRLGAPLTAMLLTPLEQGDFGRLCDYLQMRLRRSDIICRLSANESTLAILLPDTNLADTEALIQLIRPEAPPLQAVIMAVPDNMSLELVIERLRQTQQRAPQPPQEDTYHAGTSGIS